MCLSRPPTHLKGRDARGGIPETSHAIPNVCVRGLRTPVVQDFVSTTGTVTALADHFAAMNDDVLTHTDLCAEARLESDVVISLSHYVPRVVSDGSPVKPFARAV